MLAATDVLTGPTRLAPLDRTWSLPDRSTVLVGLDRLALPFVSSLEAEGFRATACEGPDDAFELVRASSPELIIVGSSTPSDPFSLLAQLRLVARDTLILFLVPSSDPGPALRALEYGADDVVAPPHSVGGVLLRARILLDAQAGGGNGNPGRRRYRAHVVVDPSSRLVVDPHQSSSLTGREFELLERLLAANGRVVARDELLTDIWGMDQESEAVLDATVHRLRRKLEPDPGEPRILITVRGVGYRVEAARVQLLNERAAG